MLTRFILGVCNTFAYSELSHPWCRRFLDTMGNVGLFDGEPTLPTPLLVLDAP
jgi:hypothetical protein